MPRYDLMHWSQRQRDMQARARQSTQSAADPNASREPAAERPRHPRPKPTPNPEAAHVLRLCNEGRLFELQAMVEAGGTLRVPPSYKQTPLRVALRLGFHSLIEFLLTHEADQAAKDDLFVCACYQGHLGAIELALRYGATPSALPFVDALHSLDRRTIALLLELGADPISDHPFARAFDARLRSAVGCFVDCRQTRPDLRKALQLQLDMALRQACSDEDGKWVSLLLKLGAAPRARGTTVQHIGYFRVGDVGESALEVSCRQGDVSILKRLNPDPAVDDIARLLQAASSSAEAPILRHLLKLGANLNDQPGGGSSTLDSHLRYIRWQPSFLAANRPIIPASELVSYLATLRLLLEAGARWRPDERAIAEARRSLYGVDRNVIVKVIDLLRTHEACEHGVLRELIRTGKMQEIVRKARRRSDPQSVKRRIRIGRNDLDSLLGLTPQRDTTAE